MDRLKRKAAISVLLMVSMGHLLNDMFQAVIPSIYPMIKESLGLSFMQYAGRSAVAVCGQ